jgi:phage-related protein
LEFDVISRASIDEKRVIFIGDAQADFDALPPEVRMEAAAELSNLQNGRRLKGDRYKGLSGKLSGIGEIRLNDDGNTYRVYNVVNYREVLYVLDAGIKKSVRGGAIPQQDVNRLELRHKRAKEDYAENKVAYQAEYAERSERRQRHEAEMKAKLLAAAARKPKGK